MTIWRIIIAASSLAYLADRFRTFAALECDAAPLYRQLALAVAEDEDLLALASRAVHGPVPNLLLAAVHYLLMRSPGEDLAGYYATLVPVPRPPRGAGAALRAFALERRADIEQLLQTRLVQTNEVRRALPLYLAVSWLAGREHLERIALIEIGCSAGLLLAFDRYAYRTGMDLTLGDRGSPLLIESQLRGCFPEPAPLDGCIVERIGVDLNTLDLDDPDDCRWLRALVWGDHPERLAVLDQAIEVARRVPMTLHEGDGNQLLPGILAGLEAGIAPIVFHSHALNQFPPAARERFEASLRRASERRAIYRVSLEYAGETPRVEALIYRRGTLDERTRLARYDAHGAWVEWLGGSG